MKTKSFPFATVAIVVACVVFLVPSAVAQGSLTPAGSPAPTMKSLQQIWDKIGALETQVGTLDTQVQSLQAQNTLLTTYLLRVAEAQGLGLDWVITTVDGAAAEIAGEDTSIAIGPNGYPAISYYHRTDGDLMLATYNGTRWYIETVDTGNTNHVGLNSSLAFNPDTGYPAISYYDDTDGNLRYAAKSAGGWSTTTVASAGDVGFYSSLAFRGNGAPAIAFYDRTNQRLRLAWWRPDVVGGWEFRTVSDTGNVGRGCSLAFSPQAAIFYISYTYCNPGATAGSLSIATIAYKGWDLYSPEISTIDSAIGPEGYYTSLALTPAHQPAVCYFRHSTSTLNYAEYNGSSWQITVVDDNDMPGPHCCLAFTPTGRPAISYFAQSVSDLRYAEFDGAAWRVVTIGGTGSFGLDSSLAFLPNGMPAISYYTTDDTSLRYAELRSYRLVPAP